MTPPKYLPCSDWPLVFGNAKHIEAVRYFDERGGDKGIEEDAAMELAVLESDLENSAA